MPTHRVERTPAIRGLPVVWGRIFDDGTLEVFNEDCRFALADLSTASACSNEDVPYTYNVADIDAISLELGSPIIGCLQ